MQFIGYYIIYLIGAMCGWTLAILMTAGKSSDAQR